MARGGALRWLAALPRRVTLHDFTLEASAEGRGGPLALRMTRGGALRLLAALACLLALGGCGRGHDLADLQAFIAEVEARPQGAVPPLPEFQAQPPFNYQTGGRRSPFAAPVPALAVPEAPAGQGRQQLAAFPLAALTMVGSLSRGPAVFGLVEDSDGGVHRVAVGDFLGSEWGQVERIEETGMDLAEMLPDGNGGWLRRPRRLELREAP